MAHRLAWMLAAAAAAPTVVVMRERGDVALAGPSLWAQALALGAGLVLVVAAAASRDDRAIRRWMLAAGGAAWLAAEWANPGAPGALAFTVGLMATGLALPLVLGAVLSSMAAGRRLGVAALGIAAGGAALQGPLAALAADPRGAGCTDCPPNLLALAARPELAERLGDLGAWLAVGACAIALMALLRGLWLPSPVARRRHGPVAGAVGVFAAATATELWLSLRENLAAPGVRGAHLVAAAALVALAAGTRAWPLLLRRARDAVAAATTAVQAATTDAVAGALAPVVGDTSLTLAYAVPDAGWVDSLGHRLALPAPGSDRRATVIEDQGAPLAALVHDAHVALDQDLLEQVVAAARLRLDAERLQAVVLARVEELRSARRRVVAASEEERRRLERDLHDGAQQRLVALRFRLGLARSRAERSSLPVIEGQLAAVDDAVARALEELRELAHGLYPPSLDAEGLATAVRTAAERAGIIVVVDSLPERRLTAAVERTAYRVLVDTLSIAERGGARSARVEASEADERLTVRVEHDARHEDPGSVALLDDRVGVLGGWLRIERASGQTIVVAQIPCA